ncbi:hypothetical protein Zmor_009581 [Zophobas morio]|uniref:Uncharacterized protein n=1 Tax=Zophobas morio TaxID=2755281 RepID=A0AA38MIQ0_9CUCU|nr:hypothetical protein Zmor_009581 [Zophobas morio]
MSSRARLRRYHQYTPPKERTNTMARTTGTITATGEPAGALISKWRHSLKSPGPANDTACTRTEYFPGGRRIL